MWVRREPDDSVSCALRFQVERGKGVLRVSRPGVLIVPPARTHGFEDRLTPDQVRQSQFLLIPGPGRPRQTFHLVRLEDEQLEGLDPDTWYELGVSPDDGGHYLELASSQEVLALGGETHHDPAQEAPDPATLARVAGIVEVVSAARGQQEDLLDEVIEADPESVASALPSSQASSPDTADVERMLAGGRSAPAGEDPPSDGADDALSFADEVGVDLSQAEDVEDSPSEPDQALATSPPVHLPASMGLAERPPDEPERPPEEVETVDAQPASFQPEPPPPEPELPPLDAANDRILVRHLRWELDRRRLQVVELQGRVERLEEQLRQAGIEPDQGG